MKIPLSKIKPSPMPVRKTWNEEKMQELAASIKDQGLIVPIKVRPIKNEYEIVYGHRRAEATRRAGLKEIECIVEGVEDPMIHALIENVVREDMNDVDKRDALREIKKRTGKTWAEVGRMFGWSERRVKEIASISDEEAAVLKGRPGALLSAADVAKSRVAGHDSIKVLEKAAREGLSKRQIARVAKAVAAAPSPEAKEKLLEREYNPTIHDPDWIASRAKKYGAHDPIYRDKKPRADQSWRDAPEVISILDDYKEWTNEVRQHMKAAEAGKLSPEAYGFIARKARRFAGLVMDFAEMLEA